VPVVSDELWSVVEPLLPQREPPKTGRPRIDDRRCFSGILFVLATGIACVKPVIARRGIEHGSGRRLRIRWERRSELHLAFLSLACALICWRQLRAF
jgi:transposase